MGNSVAMLERHYGHILASHKRAAVERAGFRLGRQSDSNGVELIPANTVG
jgi:hypothetical protein